MSIAAIAAIVMTGLTVNNPIPGTYVQINYAAGQVAGYQGARPILVLANKLSTGSAVNDTKIYGPDTSPQLASEDDIIALAGAGSEAHRLYLRVTAVNTSTSLYFVFVTESTGAKASASITLTGTAGSNATFRTYVGDDFVDTPITQGDTPTVIAANAVVQINNKTRWAATATSTAGVITLTANQKGLRGNWLRFFSIVIGPNTVTTTTSTTQDAFFTGGTTADSNTTALGTIAPRRMYYIVSADETASGFGAVVSQVNTQALPTNGRRQRAFAGSIDTLANAITVAIGINAARAEIPWQEKSPLTPAELAANAAAVYALEEGSTVPETSFVGYGNDPESSPNWLVPKSRVDSAAASTSSIAAALSNGLSPIANNTNGTTYLVTRITTYSLSGAAQDYRVRPAHKVTIPDFWADDAQTKLTLQNARKKIGDNPAKNQPPPGGSVLTPDQMYRQLCQVLDSYAANDLLENVDDTKSNMRVQREQNPRTRMMARVPLDVIDNLEQMGVVIDQVG